MKRTRVSTANRIYRGVPIFFGVQVLFYVCMTLLYRLPLARLFAFAGVAAGYHFLFYLGLRRVQREFSFERTGQPLRGFNLPLMLTFLRLTSVPTVVFLFLAIRSISIPLVLAPFLVVVFLTDLLDGLLARLLHQQTRLGRIVDAAGDYLLILTVAILFGVFRLIPWWLVSLVLVRLCLQSAGIVVLYLRRGYSSVRLTFLGKASVFSTFCLYGFELAKHLEIPVIGSSSLTPIFELAAAGIITASVVDKILYLRREFSTLRGEPPSTGTRGSGAG